MKTKKRPGRRTRWPGIVDMGDRWYRLRVRRRDPQTGRWREKERMVEAASLSEARTKLLELEKELLGTDEIDGARPAPRQLSRLGAVAREWLDRKLNARRPTGEHRLAPTTRDRYQQSVTDAIVPYLGEMPIEQVTRATVAKWRDHLGSFYAASTVNGHLRVLREVLRDAGYDDAAKAPGLPEDDVRITPDEPNMLEGEEVERFVKAAAVICPEHLAFLLVLFTTSWRISTVIALEKTDFDPERGVVVARRRRSKKEVLEGVKRSRATRDVAPLLPEVWEAVQEHWSDHKQKQAGSGLAFPSRQGGYRSRSFLDRWIPRILEEAKIQKRFTPHGVRRTSANEYRRAVGQAMSKRFAGHLTDEMHEHYTMLGHDEVRAAGELTFGMKLRVIDGGGNGGAAGGGAAAVGIKNDASG